MNNQSPSKFEIASASFDAERAIVAKCLVSADAIAEASGKITANDFEHPFLAACFGALVGFADEGRKPSVESLVSVFGNVELEAGLTTRDFLNELVRGSFVCRFIPVEDAVGVIRENTQRRTLSSIGSEMFASAAGQKGVAEIITEATARLDEVAASTRQSARSVYNAVGAADAAFEHMEGTARTSPTTGLADLDKMLGGWPKGELSVLAGRPGMGKSAVASTCLIRAAKAKHGCMFFSLEMTAKQLGARILTDLAYTADRPIYYQDILRRNIDEPAKRRLQAAREFLGTLPIVIEEQRGLTISDIATRARKQAAKWESEGGSLDVLYVDHMLLVKASQRYAGNRVREVAEISDGLASLAKELNCAIVALCQLNRGVEGRDVKRPALSDLRDSGAIEEDASTVTFIYRPAYYLEQMRADSKEAEEKRAAALDASKHLLELIVAKNRNGAVGIVDVFVDIGANAVRNKAYGG